MTDEQFKHICQLENELAEAIKKLTYSLATVEDIRRTEQGERQKQNEK